MSERVVVQLNINANKKEDVYYKDKNKDEIYKVIGEKNERCIIRKLYYCLNIT